MRIETEGKLVSCPRQNWAKIPHINCTGTPTQSIPKCRYFDRTGSTITLGSTDIDHVHCNYPLPKHYWPAISGSGPKVDQNVTENSENTENQK